MSWERFGKKKEAESPKTPVARIPKEKAFSINFTDPETGEEYAGDFIVKRPTVFDQQEIEGVRAEMLHGYYYSANAEGQGISFMAHFGADQLAFLQVCIKEAPQWWKDGEIYSRELIREVFKEAIAVDPLRKRLFGNLGEAVERDGEDSDTEHISPDDRSSFTQMVGEQVSHSDQSR